MKKGLNVFLVLFLVVFSVSFVLGHEGSIILSEGETITHDGYTFLIDSISPDGDLAQLNVDEIYGVVSSEGSFSSKLFGDIEVTTKNIDSNKGIVEIAFRKVTVEVDEGEAIGCTDSDNGRKGYYIKGEVKEERKYSDGSEGGSYSQDRCIGFYLDEKYCSDSNEITSNFVECVNGCKNGACLEGEVIDIPDEGFIENIVEGYFCTDSDGLDGSESIFKKGIVEGSFYFEEPGTSEAVLFEGRIEDFCVDGETLREHFCAGPTKDEFWEDVKCEKGCFDGACIGDPVDIPEEAKESFSCQGCTLENKCYPLGYRKSGEFCSDDFKFVGQTEAGEMCENNFECGSNVCVSGECVSGSLISKILNWFRKLFS